jgi:hypothetical protein
MTQTIKEKFSALVEEFIRLGELLPEDDDLDDDEIAQILDADETKPIFAKMDAVRAEMGRIDLGEDEKATILEEMKMKSEKEMKRLH